MFYNTICSAGILPACPNAPVLNENFNLIQQPTCSSEIEYRRLGLLGNDLLGAIVIDYLYDRFPDRDQGKLTQWKSKLVDKKELFTKEIKVMLGRVYLESERDFSLTRNWLVDRYLKAAIDEL